MRIRRIEVHDFRKLGHLVVEGLGDGLNVLVGDNEAGKSTLLAALRAVLFERHRVGGEAVRAMLPRGQIVRPEISIDFEIAGGAYRLRKAFNQRPEAELTGPGIPRLTGDAVEEQLAALLGFQAPGARGSKPGEHQGVYGLLWVEQGMAHTAAGAGGGQGTLATALESEVGQVLGGGRGRALLAAAEGRRDAFWDRRDTPKPKGDFRDLQTQIASLETQRNGFERRLGEHDDKVALLAQKVEALGRHQRDDRLAGAVRALEAARLAVGRSTQLRATLDELARARQRAELDRNATAERALARRTMLSRADETAKLAALSRSEAAASRAALGLVEGDARQAATELDRARAAREAADEARAAAERALSDARVRDSLARHAKTLADAEDLSARRADAAAAAAAVALTPKDLADLDRRCVARDAAVLQRDAASAQVGFAPEAGGSVHLDGVPVEAGKPLLLSKDAVLDLGGFGRLTIRPGGGVSVLAEAVDAAERRVAERLRQLGQPGRNDVANLLARKVELDAEAAGHGRVLAVLAPDGLDALRAQVRALDAAVATSPATTVPATEDAIAAARRDRAERVGGEKAAAAEAGRADGAREAAARQAAVLDERAATAGRDADAAASAVTAARFTTPDARLDAELAEAEARRATALDAETAAGVALEAADPEVAALTLQRAERAEAAVRDDVDTLTREKRDLEVELRTLGQDGLGELLDETEGQLLRLRRRLDAETLEAQASLLLHRTLAAAQRESKDRWLGPVRERVRPYLRLVQPDTDIVLNETNFSIEHLVRGGVAEPFDSLSVGAREQVAVITRLALADILRASGQPSAIILDDALVNTDETRLDRMHLVLQKAAERLQILILTCRERDFVGLGAPIRRV